MAKMTVDQLKNALITETYTPRTEEELRSEAEKRYQTQYNQQKLTAQQNYDTSDLAYQQQLTNLADTLASNQQTVAKNTQDSMASANRYMITRGMQRSSYGAANQASIQNEGNKSLAALLKQYTTDANSIESNRTLLAQQLADTLAQYDIDYLNDIQSYMDEQKQLDYDRKVAADQAYNNLQMQLFEYSRQYDSSGGGSSRRRSSSSSSSTTSNTSTSSGLWDSISGSTGNDKYNSFNAASNYMKYNR